MMIDDSNNRYHYHHRHHHDYHNHYHNSCGGDEYADGDDGEDAILTTITRIITIQTHNKKLTSRQTPLQRPHVGLHNPHSHSTRQHDVTRDREPTDRETATQWSHDHQNMQHDAYDRARLVTGPTKQTRGGLAPLYFIYVTKLLSGNVFVSLSSLTSLVVFVCVCLFV